MFEGFWRMETTKLVAGCSFGFIVSNTDFLLNELNRLMGPIMHCEYWDYCGNATSCFFITERGENWFKKGVVN